MNRRFFIVALHNWSDEGACVDARGVRRIGEEVKLTSNHFSHSGRVCWIRDGRAGIEFETTDSDGETDD